MLLFSRQGKLRLQKWYTAQPDKTKKKITRDLVATILTRKPKMCSFLEWRELKVVYKRYGLFLIFTIQSYLGVGGSPFLHKLIKTLFLYLALYS